MVTSRHLHSGSATGCYLALVVALATLWSLTGCVQPADRVLVDQSIGAAVHIQKQEDASPAVVTAAKDVELNLRTAQRGIGLPQQSQPYDPKLSEQARKESVAQHEAVDSITAWVTGFVGDNLPWGGTIVTTLTAAWLFLKKRLADKKTFALYTGVSDGKKALKNLLGSVSEGDLGTLDGRTALAEKAEETLMLAMKTRATMHNVYDDIHEDVTKFKNSGHL